MFWNGISGISGINETQQTKQRPTHRYNRIERKNNENNQNDEDDDIDDDGFPLQLHGKIKAKPFNPWDPNNWNKKEAYWVMNKV